MANNMLDRKTKLRLFNVWLSKECICGKNKHPKHWMCIDCSVNFQKTPLNKEVARACDNHGKMVIKMLDFCKENYATEKRLNCFENK